MGELTEMVKRKAEVSIDEWLGNVAIVSHPTPAHTTATTSTSVLVGCPTVMGLHPVEKGQLVTSKQTNETGLVGQLPTGDQVHVAKDTADPSTGEPAGAVEDNSQQSGSRPVGERGPVDDPSEWFWRLLEQVGYELW